MISNELFIAILTGLIVYIVEMSMWFYSAINRDNMTRLWCFSDVFGTYIYYNHGVRGVFGMALGEFNITMLSYTYIVLLLMKMLGYHISLNNKITDTKNDIPIFLAYLCSTWVISYLCLNYPSLNK